MAQSKKSNPLLVLLAPLWGLFKLVFFMALACILFMEVTPPSLDYSKGPPAPYRSAQPADWTENTGGTKPRTYRTKLTTHDYRSLQIDVFAPPNMKDAPLPLTIIIAGFMSPEWLFEKVRPHGNNAVIFYTSPRLERMNGPFLPSVSQSRNASGLSGYWNLMATNPLNHIYSIHAGLHEAPADIVDIVSWAVENVNADVNRINIIGLGSGSLIASAAADALQVSGKPPRTLTLIYPPADMSSAITDNLIRWPRWVRDPLARLLELNFFRLGFERHLPYLSYISKLLVIPENAFELATYAAEPAIRLAGDKTDVVRHDLGYKGYYTDENTNGVRDIVGQWLISKGAIQAY